MLDANPEQLNVHLVPGPKRRTPEEVRARFPELACIGLKQMIDEGVCKAEAIANVKAQAAKNGLEVSDAEAERHYENALPNITLQPFSEIKARSVDWLWANRIPRGSLTLFAGDPGVGKSFTICDLSARISRGLEWPDESGNAPLGDVIILSAEDGAEDTIKPRLDAAGADSTRVYRVCARVPASDKTGKRKERFFDLEKDVDDLRKLLHRLPGTKLIIVDPISSYLGRINDFRELEVRQALAPLIELAAEFNIAIIGIKHFNKDSEMKALYRMSGSIGYVAAARAAYVFAKDPKDKTRRFMRPIKANLVREMDGLAYRLSDDLVPHIEWLGPVDSDMDIEECLDEKRGPKGEQLDEAKEFLMSMLVDGSELSKTIQQEAKKAGISWRTVRRAKEALGVRAERADKSKIGSEWWWKLPDDGLSFNPLKASAEPEVAKFTAIPE